MADIELKSFPFDSMKVLNEQSGEMEDDRLYEAQIFRDYFRKFLSNGVYFGTYKNYGENSMKVSLDTGLTIKVAKGCGIIEGVDYENESDRLITFDRPASGNRVDRVVVQMNSSLDTRMTKLIVKQGTGTTPAELIRTDNVYEICLAEVTVKSTSNIADGDIVDKRLDTNLCGIVNSLISVDGEELYQQFQEYVDSVTENLVRKDQNSTINGNIVVNSITDTNNKGLSKNDFTDDYKSKLDGIATGANKTEIANNLTTTNTGKALDAYQGKVLNDKVNTAQNTANTAQNTANTARAEAQSANSNANSKLDLSGGLLYGYLYAQGILPDGKYDLGSTEKPWDYIHATHPRFYGAMDVYDSINVYNGGIDVKNGPVYVDNSSIRAPSIYNDDTVTNTPNMYVTSNGWFRRSTNTSSQRYKKDIKDLKDEELNSEKLYDLKVKQFKYKKEYQPNEKDTRYNKNLVGFIAEDVAEIYPIAADFNEEGQVENWNERYLIPAMLDLIQKQNERIKVLEEKVLS